MSSLGVPWSRRSVSGRAYARASCIKSPSGRWFALTSDLRRYDPSDKGRESENQARVAGQPDRVINWARLFRDAGRPNGPRPVENPLCSLLGAARVLAWLLAHPVGILPVMGTNRVERIKAFSDALKVNMDRETWFELYEAANGHEVA